MQCVVLAGGLGTRMRPATEAVPKAMLEVAGKPFVDWQLELLARGGVERVLICTGHLGEQIADHVGDGTQWGLAVQYSSDGETLLGTGGALRRALDRDLLGERFLVTYGDAYLSVDLRLLMDRLDAVDVPAVMSVWHNCGAIVPSNADLDGTRVVYRKTVTDPALEYVDYGMLALQRSVIEGIEPDRVVDLAAVLEELSAADAVAGFEVTERCYEVGSPEGLTALAERLRR